MSHPPNSRQGMMAWITDTWQAQRNPNRTGSALAALPVTLTLALALMATLVWMVGFPTSREAQAMPAAPSPLERDTLEVEIIRVATTGADTTDCGTEDEPCRTVQHAVDKAQPGGEIWIAAGTYTGTNSYGGLSQLVYLTKTLTIRGSYNESNWTMPDPESDPTTVMDAEGAGRVMVISPTITVHLEGLRFEAGDATGLGGGLSAALTSEPEITDAGGGLYVLTATVTISNSVIFSNTGSVTGTVPGGDVGGLGGGIYVRGGSVELTNSEIVSNTAGVNVYSFGGGIYIDRGSAVLMHNVIMSNTACISDTGYGGGLYLHGGVSPDPLPSASLIDNTFQGNHGSRTTDGWGGGMYAHRYILELLDNRIQYNTGGTGKEGKGGGLYIYLSEALLERNLVRYNVANRGEEGTSGGAHFCTCDEVTLRNNIISSNTANTFGNGYGGGVSFCKTTATLDSNLIISNTATLSTTAEGWGGGVWTGDRASVSMSNDIIAGNHARTRGAGLWFGVENDGYNYRGHRLQHVTIADNSGDYYGGHGLYVTQTLAYLTNTIIASHTFGVFTTSGGKAVLESTLWYQNNTNTAGSQIQTSHNYYEGDPAFVDPENWDYHIGEGSAALDLGVPTGVHTDMDGERRPWLAPDLGADEIWPIDLSYQTYLPLILRQ